MRVAIPTQDSSFCPHFGRSTQMTLCELDAASHGIDRVRVLDRKQQGCDSLPAWLAEMSVELVVAGGIGGGAQHGLAQRGIAVSVGHRGKTPLDALRHYLEHMDRNLPNSCGDQDHEHHHCRSH